MTKLQKRAIGALALTGASLAPLAAHAAVDVSSVVTAIEGAEAPIVLIGGAVLSVIVVAYVFKWIRRAF